MTKTKASKNKKKKEKIIFNVKASAEVLNFDASRRLVLIEIEKGKSKLS